jgi:hypothetical protein
MLLKTVGDVITVSLVDIDNSTDLHLHKLLNNFLRLFLKQSVRILVYSV